MPVIRVAADGNDFDVYVDGTLKLSRTDSTHAAGRVALGGDKPLFDDLRIGFDLNSDGDIDDVGTDKVVFDENFSSTSVTYTYDDAGNLVDDGEFVYYYDAWNRLVKVVNAEDTSVTIHAAEFDGQGRRIRKIVTNAGQYDGTVVFYYNGWKMIETRDGSGNLYQQFIHGTQYIDEIVMARIADKGEAFVHQDANWNVIALTDMGGHVLERYEYTPYGQFTAHEVTGYGDRDGDGLVNSTDKGTPGTTCSGTLSGACRILDLDFDGDYDAADGTLFDALPQGLARHPGLLATAVHFPFAHQGLYFDPELGSYQNRHRQYDPKLRRFMQRDPLGYVDGISLQCYTDASPTGRRDPGGLFTLPNLAQVFLGGPVWFARATAEFGNALASGLVGLLSNLLSDPWGGAVAGVSQWGYYCSPNAECWGAADPPTCGWGGCWGWSGPPAIGRETGKLCPEPQDELDACCRLHDACYLNGGPQVDIGGHLGEDTPLYASDERGNPMHRIYYDPFGTSSKCDQALCSCIGSLNPPVGSPMWHFRERIRVVFFCDFPRR